MPVAAVEIIQLPMLKIRWNTVLLQIHKLLREHRQKEDILYEISTEKL